MRRFTPTGVQRRGQRWCSVSAAGQPRGSASFSSSIPHRPARMGRSQERHGPGPAPVPAVHSSGGTRTRSSIQIAVYGLLPHWQRRSGRIRRKVRLRWYIRPCGWVGAPHHGAVGGGEGGPRRATRRCRFNDHRLGCTRSFSARRRTDSNPTRTCVGCSPSCPGPSRSATSKRCCRPGSHPPISLELHAAPSSSPLGNDAVPGALTFWPPASVGRRWAASSRVALARAAWSIRARSAPSSNSEIWRFVPSKIRSLGWHELWMPSWSMICASTSPHNVSTWCRWRACRRNADAQDDRGEPKPRGDLRAQDPARGTDRSLVPSQEPTFKLLPDRLAALSQ